jgi:hypothetical protein
LLRNCVALLWFVPALAAAETAAAQAAARPADTLLRLVPSDAAVVLTVEGLREEARAFAASRLAADLWQLPAVKAWRDSAKYQQFEQSRAQIEALVGASLTDLRDGLLGDAVVLAIHLPPEAPADPTKARGLLLFQARDQALLARLIRAVNRAQREGGELTDVAERRHGGTIYYLREFPRASGRPTESYVVYPDGTFAFSNSETMIQGVIERRGLIQAAQHSTTPTKADGLEYVGPKPGPGLGDHAKLKAVERRLPRPALARLFVDPRQCERLLAAAPPPKQPTDARVMALLKRYVAAVDYAGAALVWNKGAVVVHTVETLDPANVAPWLRRWAGDSRRRDPALGRVPTTALAVASVNADALALDDAVSQLVPKEDQPKLANIETVLTGLLLGQDLRSRILPHLGPGFLAYLDSPSETEAVPDAGKRAPARSSWLFPLVLVMSLGDEEPKAPPNSAPRTGKTTAEEPPPVTVARAIDNAFRTLLALTAMDEKRNQGRSRITTRVVAGITVTTLDFPISFAYAIDARGARLVLGTSVTSVARYLEAASDPKAGERFRRLQAAAFPDDETFFCVDLDAFSQLASRYRDRVVQTLAARKQRPASEVDRDLTQVLALARLFEAVFLTSRLDPDATAVHHKVGLMLHDEKAESTRQP